MKPSRPMIANGQCQKERQKSSIEVGTKV
jgi:hypothetical protein